MQYSSLSKDAFHKKVLKIPQNLLPENFQSLIVWYSIAKCQSMKSFRLKILPCPFQMRMFQISREIFSPSISMFYINNLYKVQYCLYHMSIGTFPRDFSPSECARLLCWISNTCCNFNRGIDWTCQIFDKTAPCWRLYVFPENTLKYIKW